MSKVERDFVLYVAGFFDGEGSVGVYPNARGSYFLRTQVTQNVSPAVTALFAACVSRWGGNFSTQVGARPEGKYNWQLGSHRCVRFLEEILPFSRLKRDQIEIAVAWQTSRAVPQKGIATGRMQTRNPAVDQFNQKVARLLSSLKQQDIDTVMSHQSDLVEVLHTLKQVLCVKG